MEKHILQERIINEVDLIPSEKLPEVYDILHFFRVGLMRSRADDTEILSFAGCWKDMPDEKFNSFTEDVKSRRRQAFLDRKR
ncbi:hypothetical protein BEH94_10325 [Candidatus Altiarchaeales archaeon WOR_SM1_SCG]|nr:hypothetical protein BEH94_10325 [Candidatus Altiarchaeales archaeon WOR_SM1_SCG]